MTSRPDSIGRRKSFLVENGVPAPMYGVWRPWYAYELSTLLQTWYKGYIFTDSCNQTFELITGDYLFDPQSGTKYGKDDDHIAQIIELLGPFPRQLYLSGKWSQEIFNRKGELRNIHRLRHWALPDVLKEKYHFSAEEGKRIAEFLTPMLELEPAKRANAGGMSASPFLDDTPGMEDVNLPGAVVGSRGEGIEGWATEVKKR